MPTLPNILSALNTGSFQNNEPTMFSGTPGQANKPFDQVMTQALSPSTAKIDSPAAQGASIKIPEGATEKSNDASAQKPSVFQTVGQTNLNEAEIAISNSPFFQKNPKTSPQKAEAGQAKPVNVKTETATDSSSQPEAKNLITNPEIVPAQIFAPIVALNEMTAKTATAVPFAGESAGILAVPAALRNFPAPNEKVATNPQSQASAKVILTAKADAQFSSNTEAPVGAKVAAATNAMANSADLKMTAVVPKDSQAALPAANDKTDSKTSVATVQSVTDFVQAKSFIATDSDAKTATQAQPNFDGTPTAQLGVAMKEAEKTSKTIDLTGKFLPGDVVSASHVNNLPVRADQISATESASASAQNNVATVAALADGSIEAPAVADVREQTLERMHDLVATHALRVGDAGADSLQVVIKPGAGTQLSLELRQRDDGVEAQAVLQRGDFPHLNQRWPELQQQLEQRGIRLAPLANENDLAGGGSRQQQNSPPESDSFSAGTFSEIALAPLPKTAVVQPVAQRGWETWA